MFTLWYTRAAIPIPASPSRPVRAAEGHHAGGSGTLVDDRLHPRDITSTMVDLAVHGYIKIEQIETTGLLFHGKDYDFHLLKPHSNGETWRRTNASCWKTFSGAARTPTSPA